MPAAVPGSLMRRGRRFGLRVSIKLGGTGHRLGEPELRAHQLLPPQTPLLEGNTPTSTQHPSPTASGERRSPMLCCPLSDLFTLMRFALPTFRSFSGRMRKRQAWRGEVREAAAWDGRDSEDFSEASQPLLFSTPQKPSHLFFTVRVSPPWTPSAPAPHTRPPNGPFSLEGRSGEDLTPGSPGALLRLLLGAWQAYSFLHPVNSQGLAPAYQPALLCDACNPGPKTEERKARQDETGQGERADPRTRRY